MASPPPIISPTGIIHVLGYTPTEGERGVPITVRIHFHPDLADAMYVRLVVGNKAVPTKVRQLPAVTYGRWQLHAAAPPFDRLQFPSTKVRIAVQALNEDNAILDSVTFGEFSYWTSGTHDRSTTDKLPRLHIPDSTLRRRSVPHLPTPSPTTSERSPFQKSSSQHKTRLHRRMKSQSLIRTKHQPNNAVSDQEDIYAQTPVLDLVTPLSSICAGWTHPELSAGRRLVRFSKVQDGRRLIVSCEPILQEDYCESDSVISCIYREQSDTCFVTSVDVIYLLERLTNGEFPVEEKNRIRRNLEGLRPTTVSKHKPGFGDFFQRIMEFPDPKPRNIEKDLKVFEWNLLGQALEKILSKYSIYTSPAESTPSSSADTSLNPDSPELYAIQLSYPPPEDPNNSRFLDQKACIPKYEPLPDNFPISAPGFNVAEDNGESDPGPSPVDSVVTTSSSSPSSPAFPLCSGPTRPASEPHPHDAHSWVAPTEFKPGEMVLENFNHILASYEVVEPVGGNSFADASGLDFYDNFSFHGITDDALANLADQYI